MLKRLRPDPAVMPAVMAAPAAKLIEPRTRVLLLGGTDLRTCVVRNTRRLVDAAYPHIEWIDAVADNTAARLRPAAVHSGLVLSAPAADNAARPWQSLEDDLFATLTLARTVPGLAWNRPENGPDVALIRHLHRPPGPRASRRAAHELMSVMRVGFEFARLNRRPSVTGTCDTRLLGAPGSPLELAFRQTAAAFPDVTSECLPVSRLSRRLIDQPNEPATIVTTGPIGRALAELAASSCPMPQLMPEVHLGATATVFTSSATSQGGFDECGFANPVGTMLSAVMLLHHIGASVAADTVEHALAVTLDDGNDLTPDIACRYPGVTTRRFTDAVIGNLGIRSGLLNTPGQRMVRLPAHAAMDLSPATSP